MSEKKEQVSMLDFVRAHTESDSIREVAEKTGLTEQSVQARASKYRQPEYKMTPKLNAQGEVLYRTEDGGETTDKAKAKHTKQGKAIKVMVRELDGNGQPIVTRKAINLKKFPKGGGTRLDVDAANALIAELLDDEDEGEDADAETAAASA